MIQRATPFQERPGFMNLHQTVIPIMAACALPAALQAQWTLPRSVIAGGGVSASGGTYTLDATAGQPEASPAATGGGYSLTGGFWRSATVVPVVQPRIEAESLIGDQIRLSWPVTATGFVLEQSASFAPSEAGISWNQVPPPYETNGPRVSLAVPLAPGDRFYRLRKP